jgi:WD40 repeat protein
LGPVFHPDGQKLATFGSNRNLRFWSGVSGQPISSVRVTNNARALAFSPDGRYLVAATYASFRGPDTLTLWDAQTGGEVASLRGHTGQVSQLAFSPDGRRLASADSDAVIILWDLDGRRELLTFRGHKGAIDGLAFSPDGSRLASSGSDGTLRIWDARRGEENAGAEPSVVKQ